jgi:uncharacterized membrane protein YeaQ/YmgE (transglycosylase-associated protein family)
MAGFYPGAAAVVPPVCLAPIRRGNGAAVSFIWFLLVLFVFGFVFGAIARAIVPGRDPMGCTGTWALGIAGSLVGGFLGYAIFGADLDDGAVQFGGILGSIIGSVIVLLVLRAVSRRR